MKRSDELHELYAERAEWAELEGDIARERQSTFEGGFWCRVFGWLERSAARGRQCAQDDIDEINKRSGRL